MGRIEHTNGMHELLDGDRGVIVLANVEQVGHDLGGLALQTVDVNAGIEQERLSRFGLVADERKFCVATA